MAQQVDKKRRPKPVFTTNNGTQKLYDQQAVRHAKPVNKLHELKQELLEAENEADRFAMIMYVLGALCVAEFIIFWLIW